ncbi:hypothetical protein ACTFIV_000268 [Dictyostelium citrinum]
MIFKINIYKKYEKNGYLEQVLNKLYNNNYKNESHHFLKLIEFTIFEVLMSTILKENLLNITEINNSPFNYCDVVLNNEKLYDNLECDKLNKIEIRSTNKKNKKCFLFFNLKSYSSLGIIKLNTIPFKNNLNNSFKDPIHLLDLIRNYGWSNNENLEFYKSIVENSIANYILSFIYSKNIRDNIRNEAFFNRNNNIMEYVDYKFINDPNFNEHIFYEKLLLGGSFNLPISKTKKGLSPEQVLLYGSEFSNNFSLNFIAIHKSISFVLSNDDDGDHGSNSFKINEQVFKIFKSINLNSFVLQYFLDNNLNLNEYYISVIHPFQNNKNILNVYNSELENKKIIILPYNGENNLMFTPGISTRTVFPINNGMKENYLPCIKSSMAIVLTSHLRNIRTKFLYNHLQINQILNEIKSNKETEYFKNIDFLNFLFLVSANSNNLDKQPICTIFRENPHIYSNENCHVIVGATLYEISPITSKPIYYEIIKKFIGNGDCYVSTRDGGLNDNFENNKSLVKKWFENYIHVISKPYFILYLKYGISIEAHLQNTLCLINSKTGNIEKFLFRDWEGVTISKERLEKYPDLIKHIKTLTPFVTSDKIRRRIFYSFINSNIGELVYNISKDFNFNEKELWNIVLKIFTLIFNEIKNGVSGDMKLKESIEKDENYFFKSKLVSVDKEPTEDFWEAGIFFNPMQVLKN